MTTSQSHLLVIRETTPEIYDTMTPAGKRAALEAWNAWVDTLAARATMRDGNTLDDRARVVSGAGGSRVVDGPYAESKEVVAGYFVVSAADLDEVTALVRECPLLRYGMTIEIRPIGQACHLARALGMRTMREPAGA